MTMQVLGIKHVKGSFAKETTGEIIDYDYIAVHVVIDLQGGDNVKGASSAILRLADSKQWNIIKQYDYPGFFDVSLKMIADGKGGFKQECSGLTPSKAAA